MALEAARLRIAPEKPSRLNAAFVFLSVDEANRFRYPAPPQRSGFEFHALYRVALREPDVPHCVVDWRLVNPVGDLRPDWAEAYWADASAGRPAAPIPGVDWAMAMGTFPHREMLTLSHLVIEERLD
jgi:hypothetical protein